MVRVGVGICPPRDSGDDSVMVCQARKFEVRSVLELGCRSWARGTAASGNICRRDIVGEVVFGDYFQGLLKDFPKLDSFVVRRQQIVRGILSSAPLDLVDLFFYLERLEVVKFGLVRLKFRVKLVLA